MVEKTINDYMNYLQQIDFSKEINPICANIDEILTRMEEFENSISIIKNISTQTPLPNIVECKQDLLKYAEKIYKMQVMLDRINFDIKALEQNVTIAEEELGYNDTKFRGFFKPFLKKVIGKEMKPNDNQDAKELAYKPIEIFQQSDYFPDSSNN